MQKIFWTFLLSIILFSCIKPSNQSNQTCGFNDSQTVAPDSEAHKVSAYLDSNHIHAQKDSSGFYYVSHSQGAGAFVTNLCSVVTVYYKGMLTNGTVFDSTETNVPSSFQLGQVIVGWQKAIPKLNKGGSITLYIPPTLGYSSQAISDNNGHLLIPPNSILIFDIEVLDISG